jgi:hypothetical protein
VETQRSGKFTHDHVVKYAEEAGGKNFSPKVIKEE